MNTNLTSLKEILGESVKSAGYNINHEKLNLSPTKTFQHGHFATNVALILAKSEGLNPREIAQKIADQLLDQPYIEKVEVAGPGFINLFIEQKFYSNFCKSLAQNFDDFISSEACLVRGQKVVIEYSSPNVAKPLGVHHLLSTVIGDSLSKLLKRTGAEVISENYPGDIGTQFGKLIYAIKTKGDFKKIEKDPIEELLKLYVDFHEEAEKNPELDQLARDEYRKYEEGDSENRALHKKIVNWSLEAIQPLYERLKVQYDGVHAESFFEDKMQSVVQKGIDLGVFEEGKEGSLIMRTDNKNEPPAVVKKSDGTTLYLTRDLAQIEFFEKHYQPSQMIWVVDVAQSLHFKHRFEASQKLGLTHADLIHVSFGRMQFKDGQMSTRKGNIVRLSKVLDEAEKRSLELIRQKGVDLSEEEQFDLAKIMGVGSVKYNILHQNRIQNMTFEWNKILTFEGNSAPYLMYTVARAKSVIRKSGLSISDLSASELMITTNEEQKLILNLMQYTETLKRAKEEFKPNHIANYLYHLAQDFNSFYNSSPVLKAEEGLKKSRLLLISATVQVMIDGFYLLGIGVPEKM